MCCFYSALVGAALVAQCVALVVELVDACLLAFQLLAQRLHLRKPSMLRVCTGACMRAAAARAGPIS